jgi:hypothetical protein
MKNKRAVQMMIDCGNADLAILMIQRRTACMCEQMKRAGTYDENKHLAENTKKAAKRYSHIISLEIIGAPIKIATGYMIESQVTEVSK